MLRDSGESQPQNPCRNGSLSNSYTCTQSDHGQLVAVMVDAGSRAGANGAPFCGVRVTALKTVAHTDASCPGERAASQAAHLRNRLGDAPAVITLLWNGAMQPCKIAVVTGVAGGVSGAWCGVGVMGAVKLC
jgi:hypothetical protein